MVFVDPVGQKLWCIPAPLIVHQSHPAPGMNQGTQWVRAAWHSSAYRPGAAGVGNLPGCHCTRKITFSVVNPYKIYEHSFATVSGKGATPKTWGHGFPKKAARKTTKDRCSENCFFRIRIYVGYLWWAKWQKGSQLHIIFCCQIELTSSSLILLMLPYPSQL